MIQLNFDIESASIIDENPDSQFATAIIQAFSSGRNRHDMFCGDEVLQKTSYTIYNKPILYSIDKRLDDFFTHTIPGESFIAGFVVPDSVNFSRLEDSRLALNILAKIWKRYAPKAIELFKRDGGSKKVSVEMELYDSLERSDGLIEMLDFAYTGITILGDFVTEASPGANIQMLSFADEQMEYNQALELEFGKYDEIDFKIPKKIKENAKIGLELSKKYKMGDTSINGGNARFLLKNDNVNPERITLLNRVLSGYKSKDVSSSTPPTREHISWMLNGGSEGYRWAKRIKEKLDEIDNRNISYFSDVEFEDEIVTMPYTNLKDINPALKGIKPPISLSQANAISKQADAIGVSKEKNGWAIAISNFKKTHKVENGHWVRKEHKEMAEKEEFMEGEEKLEMAKENEAEPKEMSETPEPEKSEEKFEDAEEKEEKDEEKEEAEEKDEEEKKEFSLDPYLDVKATLAFLEKETETYQEIAAEFSKPYAEMNYAKVMGAMYAKMKAMAEESEKDKAQMAAYMAENDELKKFKAEKEQEQFNFSVDKTLKEIESRVVISPDELESLREESKKYNLETLDAWKNFAKARGLDFAAKETGEPNEIKKYGLPFPTKPVGDSIWKR